MVITEDYSSDYIYHIFLRKGAYSYRWDGGMRLKKWDLTCSKSAVMKNERSDFYVFIS